MYSNNIYVHVVMMCKGVSLLKYARNANQNSVIPSYYLVAVTISYYVKLSLSLDFIR